MLTGFEHVDFNGDGDNDNDDETSTFVENAANAVETEVKRPSNNEGFDIDELRELMEADDDDARYNELYGGGNSLPGSLPDTPQEPSEEPFNEGNQNTDHPFCYACQAGLANQMAHYGGCMPDPDAMDMHTSW